MLTFIKEYLHHKFNVQMSYKRKNGFIIFDYRPTRGRKSAGT